MAWYKSYHAVTISYRPIWHNNISIPVSAILFRQNVDFALNKCNVLNITSVLTTFNYEDWCDIFRLEDYDNVSIHLSIATFSSHDVCINTFSWQWKIALTRLFIILYFDKTNVHCDVCWHRFSIVNWMAYTWQSIMNCIALICVNQIASWSVSHCEPWMVMRISFWGQFPALNSLTWWLHRSVWYLIWECADCSGNLPCLVIVALACIYFLKPIACRTLCLIGANCQMNVCILNSPGVLPLSTL